MKGFVDWLNDPFDQDMSAMRWFAFVGLLIAITMAWGLILKYMREM